MSMLNHHYNEVPITQYATKKRIRSPSVEGFRNVDGHDNIDSRRYATHRRVEADWRHTRNYRKNDRPLDNDARRFDSEQPQHYQFHAKGWDYNNRTRNNDFRRSSYERSVVGPGRFTESDSLNSDNYYGDDSNSHHHNQSWEDNRRKGSWSAWHSINDYDDVSTKHRFNDEREIGASHGDGLRCHNNYKESFEPRSRLQRDRLSTWATETDQSKTDIVTASHLFGSDVRCRRSYESERNRILPHKRLHEDNYDRSCSQQSWDRRRYGESFELDNNRSVRDDDYVSRSALYNSGQQQLRDRDVSNRVEKQSLGCGQDRMGTRIQENNTIVWVSDHESRRGQVDTFRNCATRHNLISQNEKSGNEIKGVFTEDSDEDGEIEESDIPRNRSISTVDVNNIDHRTSHLSENEVNVVTETSETSSPLRREEARALIDVCPSSSDRCEDSLTVPPIVTSPDHPDSGSIMAVNHGCSRSSSSVTATHSCEKLNQSLCMPLPSIVEILHSSNAPIEDDSRKKVCDTIVPKSTGDNVLGPSTSEMLQSDCLLNDVLRSKIVTGSAITVFDGEIKSAVLSGEKAAVQPNFSVGNIPKKKRKVPIEDIALHVFCIPEKSCRQSGPKCDDSFRDKHSAQKVSQNDIDGIKFFKEDGNSSPPTEELDGFLHKEKKKKLRKFGETIVKCSKEQSSFSGLKCKSAPKSNCIVGDLMDSESDLEPEAPFISKRKNKTAMLDARDTQSKDNDEETCKKAPKTDINIGNMALDAEGKSKLQKNTILSSPILNKKTPNVEPVSTSHSKLEPIKSRKMSVPDCTDVSVVTTGSHVAIYWDGEDDYFEGIITKIKPGKKRGFRIKYDDGDKDWVNLKIERFRLLSRANSDEYSVEKEKVQTEIDRTKVLHIKEAEMQMESSEIDGKSKSCLVETTIKDRPFVKKVVSLTNATQSTDRNLAQATQSSKQQVKQEMKPKSSSFNKGNGSFKKPSSLSLNYLDRFKYQNNVERLKFVAKNNAKICSTLNRGKSINLESNKGDFKVGSANLESTSTPVGKSIPKKLSQSNNWVNDKTSNAKTRFLKQEVKTQRKEKIKSTHKLRSEFAPEDNWVKAGLSNDSSDSETDDEEIMQWASRMFGIPVSPSMFLKGSKAEDFHHSSVQSKRQPSKLCDEAEEEIRRRKEEARPLTATEIRAILKDDCGAEASHWVRRSSRQPSKSALSSPKLKSLIEKLRSNDKDMVVLKMKKYCSDSATPTIVIDTVLDALEDNTNCEALYIQNYNLGMRDEQVLHLLSILQRPSCKIWCLNIGETYNVQTETWEVFAEGLKDTKVTHMYASEHTITTELKDQIRNTIRNNRSKHNMHIDPNNIDTIVRCTHCWWNPFNAAVLRPYLKRKGYDGIFMDAEAQGLPGTMSESKYLS